MKTSNGCFSKDILTKEMFSGQRFAILAMFMLMLAKFQKYLTNCIQQEISKRRPCPRFETVFLQPGAQVKKSPEN